VTTPAKAGAGKITAETNRDFLRAPEDLQSAMARFAGAGFDVEMPRPDQLRDRRRRSAVHALVRYVESPFGLSRLAPRVQETVAAVEIPPSPDFGPGNP